MAITLNLLPQDRIVSSGMQQFLKITRMLTVISLFLFIFYSIGIGVLIYLNSTKLSTYQTENTTLKGKIAELEVSEQQIVLIKDRIKKIETLRNVPSALKNLSSVISLIETLPEKSRVTELDTDTKKVDLTVNFKSNADMETFMTTMKSSNLFKSVVMTAYSLNPTTGYLISYNLLNSK